MDLVNRRAFLRAAAAAGAGWAIVDIAEVEDALAEAGHGMSAPGPRTFRVLTAEQARVLDAFASRIIPSVDGRPGAHEAGAVHFIDQSLATFNAGQKQLYADGAFDLNRRAARVRAAAPGFAALAPADQDAILRAIEKTPFFAAARYDTIVGTFALPTWGGNRDYAGWRLLGFEHQPAFQAPFGYYDADANRKI